MAEELRNHLHERFQIAVRVREVAEGRGYRLYQVQEPAELIASKVVGHQARRGRPKSGTDWRDVAMLVLAFPELKRDPGPVSEALDRTCAGPEAMEFWRHLVAQDIREEEEQGF